MKFRLALLGTIGLLAAAPAFAQPKPNSIVGTVPTKVATYSTAFVALAPAASATDFLTLTGSSTMVVRVKQVECFAIGTANASATVNAVVRSTADSGGTAVTPSSSAGGQAVPHDSADNAASATVAAYTANPTTGTLVGIVRSGKLTNTTAASSTIESTPPLQWIFGQNFQKEVVLRGTGQVFALNGAGASFTAGAALNCSIEWTETPN